MMEKKGIIGKWHFIILILAIFVLIVLLSVNLYFLFGGGCGNLQGDANGDGAVNNLDVKHLKDFLDGQKLKCQENADFNSDGKVDILDGRALTTYLLSGKDERFSPGGEFFGREGADVSGGGEGTGLGSNPTNRPENRGENGISEECKTFVGDINGDGKIDRDDYDEIIGLLSGRKEVKCPVNADVDYSGKVDSKDKNDLREYLFGVDTISSGRVGRGNVCIENDNGDNVGVKGRVAGNKDDESYEKEDFCEGNEQLVEYYCEDKEAVGKKRACSLGCEDGKCKGEVSKPVADICLNEADIGAGIVIGFKDGKEFSEQDRCDGDVLVEFSCSGKSLVENRINCANGCFEGKCLEEITCGNNPKGLDGQVSCDTGLACPSGVACDCQEECEDGLICSEGVCISGQRFRPDEDFCTDSDNGKISSVKGSVSGFVDGVPYTKTDFCKAGSVTILIEYSCNIDSYVEEEIQCGYGGCVEGVCLQSQSNQAACEDNPAGSCNSLSCTEGQSCQCNAECASGLTCINNVCSSVNRCTTSSQCTGGLECIDGQCQRRVSTCEDNLVGCDSPLSCPLRNKCDCYAECSSGYCYGNAPLTYVCNAELAPVGAYTNNPYNCRTKKYSFGRCIEVGIGGACNIDENCVSGAKCIDGKCLEEPAPAGQAISCTNNPAGCDEALDCSADQSCHCAQECATGVCSNGKCGSSSSGGGSISGNSGGQDPILNQYTTGTQQSQSQLSCANNPIGLCDIELNCPAGTSCVCSSECSSGYCWGANSQNMVCQSSCAPSGMYVGYLDVNYCCSGLAPSPDGICRTIEV